MSESGGSEPLPSNPADCSDPLTALTLWQAKIAKDAAGAHGLTTLKDACLDMAKRAPLCDPFRDTVIKSLLRCADDHLCERHSRGAIDPIFFEAFPEQAQDDSASENAELDTAAVRIDGRAEIAAEIARLAKLPTVEYERERKGAAKRLDIRASILDSLVEGKHEKSGNGKQGHALGLPEPKPWPDPVNGADLLDALSASIRQHVVMSDRAADTATLWVLHTYLLDCFGISPRLAITSPEKQCGKTTLLDVLARLVWRPLPTANATAAAIFRVVEKQPPTLLIDEADTFLPEKDELRGILNSGHHQGGSVIRTVGEAFEPRAFSTYSACAIALIGKLPATLTDRSVPIALRRRRADEPIEAFRIDRTGHLDERARMARTCRPGYLTAPRTTGARCLPLPTRPAAIGRHAPGGRPNTPGRRREPMNNPSGYCFLPISARSSGNDEWTACRLWSWSMPWSPSRGAHGPNGRAASRLRPMASPGAWRRSASRPTRSAPAIERPRDTSSPVSRMPLSATFRNRGRKAQHRNNSDGTRDFRQSATATGGAVLRFEKRQKSAWHRHCCGVADGGPLTAIRAMRQR
jgi:hypothetical protein